MEALHYLSIWWKTQLQPRFLLPCRRGNSTCEISAACIRRQIPNLLPPEPRQLLAFCVASNGQDCADPRSRTLGLPPFSWGSQHPLNRQRSPASPNRGALISRQSPSTTTRRDTYTTAHHYQHVTLSSSILAAGPRRDVHLHPVCDISKDMSSSDWMSGSFTLAADHGHPALILDTRSCTGYFTRNRPNRCCRT